MINSTFFLTCSLLNLFSNLIDWREIDQLPPTLPNFRVWTVVSIGMIFDLIQLRTNLQKAIVAVDEPDLNDALRALLVSDHPSKDSASSNKAPPKTLSWRDVFKVFRGSVASETTIEWEKYCRRIQCNAAVNAHQNQAALKVLWGHKITAATLDRYNTVQAGFSDTALLKAAAISAPKESVAGTAIKALSEDELEELISRFGLGNPAELISFFDTSSLTLDEARNLGDNEQPLDRLVPYSQRLPHIKHWQMFTLCLIYTGTQLFYWTPTHPKIHLVPLATFAVGSLFSEHIHILRKILAKGKIITLVLPTNIVFRLMAYGILSLPQALFDVSSLHATPLAHMCGTSVPQATYYMMLLSLIANLIAPASPSTLDVAKEAFAFGHTIWPLLRALI